MGAIRFLAPRRILMPGALAPERHDNTLDGKGWFPMLSRLLGVFVLQYPVNPSFGFALYMNESYHFNTMWWIMTTIIFIPFVGSCCQVVFLASFCNLLDSLFNQLFFMGI
jgi:hypothetical protein